MKKTKNEEALISRLPSGVSGRSRFTSRRLARTIAQISLTKKARDVLILDLRKLTTITDFFVLCTGDSDTHVKAIVDAIAENLEHEKVKAWHVEGYSALKWVLMDYVDVVVHVFQQATREFYSLEALWGDAKMEEVKDET